MQYVYLKEEESGLKPLFIAFLLSSVVNGFNISELTKLYPDIFSLHIWTKEAERFTQSCSKWLSFKVSWRKNSGCCIHVTSICQTETVKIGKEWTSRPVHRSEDKSQTQLQLRAALLPDKELFWARNDIPFIMKNEVICFPNGQPDSPTLFMMCEDTVVYLLEELVSHNSMLCEICALLAIKRQTSRYSSPTLAQINFLSLWMNASATFCVNHRGLLTTLLWHFVLLGL